MTIDYKHGEDDHISDQTEQTSGNRMGKQIYPVEDVWSLAYSYHPPWSTS